MSFFSLSARLDDVADGGGRQSRVLYRSSGLQHHEHYEGTLRYVIMH